MSIYLDHLFPGSSLKIIMLLGELTNRERTDNQKKSYLIPKNQLC